MIILAIVAILSIGYGIMIMSVASGSKFFLFWIFLGFVFLICSAGIRQKWFLALPRWIMMAAGLLLGIGIAAFLFLTVKIGYCFDSRCDSPLNCIIVLGAQIKDDGPSTVLKYRLDLAADYLSEHPETVCIVTGGRGTNEKVTEARGMADYLIDQGIDEKRIILEEKARNTEENIRYSRKLIPKGGTAAVVTNNFHMYRALGIAKKQGLPDVTGIAAGSTVLFLPNNVTREVFGVVKDLITGHMVFW